MRFKILDTASGEDVLGGPVSEDNVYIALYGASVNKDDVHPHKLAVGASVLRQYNLSGTRGTYRVVRIEDFDDDANK